MSIIYTVGYEGTDIDRFAATLKAVGIGRLVDVRAVALSRKKGFSKKALAERLAEEDIDYQHFVNLGDPKPGREAARAGQMEKFRSIYFHHLNSDEAQSSLEKLSLVVGEKPTCLLCFERDPDTCHRLIVANELKETLGYEIFNLYADDPGKYVRNASRMPRYHPREGATAA